VGFFKFPKFTAVLNTAPGSAYFRRRIRARSGEVLTLQRIVPIAGGGMRAYYYGPRSGIRAVDRHRVTRVVKQTRDKVWLA
jgi:hypothetical protein